MKSFLIGSQDVWGVIEKGWKVTRWNHLIPKLKRFFEIHKEEGQKSS